MCQCRTSTSQKPLIWRMNCFIRSAWSERKELLRCVLSRCGHHMAQWLDQDEPLHWWLKEMDGYLGEILHLEGRTGSYVCKGCDREEPATFRCNSCFNGRSLCCECMIDGHHDAPFHHIEVYIHYCNVFVNVHWHSHSGMKQGFLSENHTAKNRFAGAAQSSGQGEVHLSSPLR